MKPSDKKAEAITFGVELETTIPVLSGVVVGNYHNGISVRAGVATGSTAPLNAPTFNGECWRAERDGSIRARADRTACEFVSPILSGSDGVQHLIEFVEWANAIGANVNASCGCHITVGVASIIGTEDLQELIPQKPVLISRRYKSLVVPNIFERRLKFKPPLKFFKFGL